MEKHFWLKLYFQNTVPKLVHKLPIVKEKKKKNAAKQKQHKFPKSALIFPFPKPLPFSGFPKTLIYRLIRKGKLPAVNLGKRLTRISRAHIERMFKVVENTATKQQEKQT